MRIQRHIVVKVHDATREEVEQLKAYLENNCWDWKIETEEE